MIPRLITNNGDATANADNNLLPIHDNIQAAIISVLPQLFPQRQIIEKDVLYPWQNEALEAILQHQTTMVSMPTGSGKSLVFTVLGPVINAFEKLRALHTNPWIKRRDNKFIIVVYPLVQLVNDQQTIMAAKFPILSTCRIGGDSADLSTCSDQDVPLICKLIITIAASINYS
jgi:hypothetical protein